MSRDARVRVVVRVLVGRTRAIVAGAVVVTLGFVSKRMSGHGDQRRSGTRQRTCEFVPELLYE
jgi:hypothetical protein